LFHERERLKLRAMRNGSLPSLIHAMRNGSLPSLITDIMNDRSRWQFYALFVAILIFVATGQHVSAHRKEAATER
jgi:hypothetical protein